MPNNIESKVIGILKKQKKIAISLKELAKRAGIGKNGKPELLELLERLESENKLLEANGKYTLVENLGLVTAEIVKVNATFGFAKPVEADRDIFIPGRMLLGSMPGDIVLVKSRNGRGELPEGEVFKILRESERKFSGVLEADGNNYFIIPDKYVKFPIKLAKSDCAGMKTGDKLLAQIKRRGKRHGEHIAEVLSDFGDSGKASACCESILAAHDIYPEFPLDVQEQATAIGAGTGIHPKELLARTDLRGETIFTIDGADTKDIDDAISLKKTDRGGWQLGVHIADVSYYVTYKTPVDSEAFVRGTSVYYADSVVPMLPKELSNGICSLNPGEDRLAFSVIIELGEDAKIEGYEFKKTVIRSRVKGVYSEVNAILAGNATPAVLTKYSEVSDMLFEMNNLSGKLTQNRHNRGSVDLESVESKIIIGEDGSAVDVVPRERGVSEMIIEEFMLVANECAARLAIKERLPFVYRIHERPAPDKLAQLFEMLDRLGVSYKKSDGKISPDKMEAILELVRGSELAPIVNNMILRTMAKAKYSESNTGHFGLALDDYAHFTSPIRRYPDLTIHRILSAFVTGMRKDNISKRFGTFAPQSAARSTEREIAAMTAERDCEDAYKAEYMSKRIGMEFDGVVSAVTQFGLYVTLPNTVGGLVRVQSLPHGDWQYDGSIAFYDTLGSRKIRVGDKLRIKVAAADVSAGHVDFDAVNTAPSDREYSH